MAGAHVLVVDDDARTRALLRQVLTIEGYSVGEASDGGAALEAVARRCPALVLLDVMLPGIGGLEVLGSLRASSDVPVILVTARDGERDRVAGLRLGADDYVTKPFSAAELLARIESVLRRAGPRRPPALRFDGLEIDLAAHEVRLGGRPVEMPTREFELLAFLASSPRRVYGRDEILDEVWGSSPKWQDPATVTEHVRRIRRRIEADPDRPRWIRTVRGAGYRFEP